MRLNHDFTPALCPPLPYTFICTGCECVEHRRTPALPKGWATRQDREDVFAYCPNCKDGEALGTFQARMRREAALFGVIAPMMLVCFAGAWTMLPA